MQTMGPPELDYEKLQRANMRIDELEEQCATAEDEIYTLIQDGMKLQAQAAAMREAQSPATTTRR